MSQQIEPTTINRIIFILDANDGMFSGTQDLAVALNFSTKCKPHLLRTVRRLAASGLITISRSCGGRGNKTIYKHNRNQPGQPRKVRHE
jgi:hypothetical protein